MRSCNFYRSCIISIIASRKRLSDMALVLAIIKAGISFSINKRECKHAQSFVGDVSQQIKKYSISCHAAVRQGRIRRLSIAEEQFSARYTLGSIYVNVYGLNH